MKKRFIGQKVLLTTSNWFYGPDGDQYRGVWGTLLNVHEAKEVLGFSPSRTESNRLIEIGDVVIAGCQVHYMMLCPEQPKDQQTVFAIREHELQVKGVEYETKSRILITS